MNIGSQAGFPAHKNQMAVMLMSVRDGPPPVEDEVDSIRCQRWLGGLLKHYYRQAA